MRRAVSITEEDLVGQPGLSRTARNGIIAAQPETVLEALGVRGVGRKTTKRLLAKGLLTDDEGVQRRALTDEELESKKQQHRGT
jgi:hypothetical protein